MIGAQTIGNATIVGYDKQPILATDPWLGLDHYAYFGSWYLPYEIPNNIYQGYVSLLCLKEFIKITKICLLSKINVWKFSIKNLFKRLLD